MTEPIQSLAKECLTYLETKKRDNGNEFICHTKAAPEWFMDLIHKAHDDFLPDDYKYEFILNTLYSIANSNKKADLDELGYEIEADIYTSDLIQWLASNLYRIEYVNEAMADFGTDVKDIIQYIQMGQQKEKQEVYTTILDGLRQHLGINQ